MPTHMTHRVLRKKWFEFLISSGHQEVPPIPLVPQNDPTTLFTGSGMQQLVPYLLGETHPLGTKLFNIQPCIRAQDIEDVGDNRHDTFFEMMGNWSLGDYFKKEQLKQFFTFLTDKKLGLGIDPDRLYVTVYQGSPDAPKDEESIDVWRTIFSAAGIEPKLGERIFEYDATKNWWSRAGVPANMPAGEPGGPDSEVFYRFDVPHDPAFGSVCHPNCDCGRFMEIGNSVFMQYKKREDGTFENLPAMNVDFGGGLERLVAAANNDPDIFRSDVFSEIIAGVERATGTSYDTDGMKPTMRIIADHLKTAVFIIKDGVTPSNKEQGYILRRLLRRALVKLRSVNHSVSTDMVAPIITAVIKTYGGVYFHTPEESAHILPIITEEIEKFERTLDRGLREIAKHDRLTATQAFDLYQSYGFPLEITREILSQKGQTVNMEEWQAEVAAHRAKSRSSVGEKFRGGLADTSEQTVKYHTATHLLHQALHDLLDDSVRQDGSNITAERLRFDFSYAGKPPQDIKTSLETMINQKITEGIPVHKVILPKSEAEQLGARSFFREKYPDQVNVYFINHDANDIQGAYSKEFCGGPHVSNTREIGSISVYKFEKIGATSYRVYAK